MRAFRSAKRVSLILLAVWVPMRFLYWYLAIEPETGRQWWFVTHQSLFDTFVVWLFLAGVVWLILRVIRKRRTYKGLLFTPAVVLVPFAFDVVKFALDVGDFPI